MRNIDPDSDENRRQTRDNAAYVASLNALFCPNCGNIYWDTCSCWNPTPEEMRDKLFKAGWKRGPGSSFISPKGNMFRGPAKAFKIFMTGADI